MRIELPSQEWVEIADKRKGSLAGRVTGAVMIETQDGKALIPGDISIRQTDAFLRETITDWSLKDRGIPIPKLSANGEDRTHVIGDELDEDDYAALHDAVREIVFKVVGRGRPNPPSRPALPSS